MQVPGETLFVANLCNKVKVAEMKKALYGAFSIFGTILEIKVVRTAKLRGQAWVSFTEVGHASRALQEMTGFPLFDRPMRIQFAREVSEAVAEHKGTLAEHKQRRAEAKRSAAHKRKRDDEGHMIEGAAEVAFDAERGNKRPRAADVDNVAMSAAIADTSASMPSEILFVQNLPSAATIEMLTALFQRFPGFREVSLVPGQVGIAFVEYGSVAESAAALKVLNGFQISPENRIVVTFAK